MVVARPTSRPIYTTQQLTSCRQWQRHTMASFSVSYDVIYSSFHLSRGDTVWVQKNPPAVFWHFFPNGWEFLINVLHTYTFLSTLYYDYSVQFFKKTCKYSTFVLCNNLACVNVTIDTATKNYCCLGCIAASSCILHSNTVRSSRRFSLNVHLSLQTQLWRLARKWKMKFSVLLQGRTRRWLYHPQILLNQM